MMYDEPVVRVQITKDVSSCEERAVHAAFLMVAGACHSRRQPDWPTRSFD